MSIWKSGKSFQVVCVHRQSVLDYLGSVLDQSGMLAVKNRNEQADLRAGNVWRDTGQCCRAALKSTQRTRLVKRQRQGAAGRESGCCQGVVVVQQAASLNPVTASSGRPPLALAVPPGPTQLCHTTQDQALELSKVALAALTKLHLMRAQNSNHCSPPEASSPQHLAVPSVQWSSAPCSLGSSAGICYPPALCGL